MPQAVIEDQEQFKAFLAAQPLCRWAAQKQHDIDTGTYVERGRSTIHAPAPAAPKNDNADLAAALASMA